jgi:Uma2 family endonuclease
MSTLASEVVFTPEDLAAMPDAEAVRFELVDGKLVERPMDAESSEIAAKILILLGFFLRDHPMGRLFGSDTSYQCFVDDPARVRRADVGFVRFDQLPNGKAPKGNIRAAPTLAVEVISPNDTADEVQAKVAEWLAAGVPLVWVVYPGTRTVRIHRPRSSPLGAVSDLTEADAISGEEVIPGFSCPVSEFFA